MSQTDPILAAVAARALAFVHDGAVVGLGTGRAATAFVEALGERVKQGMRVTGVPTSKATAATARRLAIPLVDLDDVDGIDVTVDGADEVDPQLNLIKGYGGAMVGEKIVAAASRREIILVGSEKLVPVLGKRGILPVEVIPFAVGFCKRRLTALGCRPQVRLTDGVRVPFVSDSGNYILDCGVGPITDPQALEDAIRAIPGVVGSGLFIGIAERVLVGDQDGVRELCR
ncbi:MAG TPA: ribose-5-phosphate isomerase RpiA [Candidatus Margulisiibacteriota bacterium]|nr:ribose-5-phosphate isomerase RpiA [Candidatus Margulisiibacteriota bacterium]